MNKKRLLVLGTGNRHKLIELTPYLSELPLELKAAGDFGPFDPEETGDTLEANALIKAQAALALSGEWSVADDTGLEVDALDGRPGVYSSRYAGVGCSYADNVRKLLREMNDMPEPKRTARFTCVIAFCRPNAEPKFFRGECPGKIIATAKGSAGFGYDPVFVPERQAEGQNLTFAELSLEAKNRISHRGLAAQKLCVFLRTLNET